MKKTFLIITLFFCLSVLNSQAVNKTIFDKITVNEGLSHSDVNSIVQDRDGFIWIGTYNGLCRYDGNKIVIYRTDNSGLSNNRILSLYVGTDSLVYIGTETGGLNIYDPKTGRIISFKHDENNYKSLASDVVNDIFEDRYQAVWVCTDGGLSKLNKSDGQISFNTYHSLQKPGELILSGCELNEKQLLLATNQGLLIFDKTQSKYLSFYRSQVDKLVHAVTKFSDKITLIASAKGLFSYDSSKEELSEISSIEALSIYVDPNRNIWVGSTKDGLYKFNMSGQIIASFQSNLLDPNSIVGNEISTLYEDESGVLWIGTIGGGISTTSMIEKKIDLYQIYTKTNNILLQKKIITFAEDHNGFLWIGTRGSGIEIMNKKINEFRNLSDRRLSIPLKDVSAFYQDDMGSMWIGTWQGLYLMPAATVNKIWDVQDVKVESLNSNFSGANISIYKIVKDRDNHLWISTSNGVYQYIPTADNYYKGQFVHYEYDALNPNSIQDDFVTDIYADPETPKKTIWVGTRKGLSKFTFESNGTRIRRIYPSDKSDGLKGEFVSVIHQDAKKQLWIVTLGGGLNKVTGGRFDNNDLAFESYNKSRYAFVNNELESLLEDSHGNFWIGGYGITKFNPSTGETKFYGIKDKLQSNSFKIWSSCKLKNGDMVFGGVNGFNIFNPDSIKDNPIVPKVVLTGLKIFSRDIHVGDTIKGKALLTHPLDKTTFLKLPYNSNSLTFEFAALHYTSPTHNKYRYMLEGFDTEWHQAQGHETYGIYTNLKPGNYRFVVYGANSDGVWSNIPATIDIEITPPFWKTTIAYSIYVILFLSILYLIIRSALKHAQQKHNLEIEKTMREEEQRSFDNKLKFFTDISHEIKTPLSLIAVPIEDLLLTPSIGNATRSKLNLANQNVERLMKLVEQILDFGKYESQMMRINVCETDIVTFVQELSALFKPLANRKKINFVSEFDAKDPVIYIDRDKMEKVVTNVLSNALKFTPNKGSIKLKCSEDEYFIYISIHDSGKGIRNEELERIFEPFYQATNDNVMGGTGIGLSLSKYIVDQHHGEMWAQSVEGNGSTFYIKLRKGKEHFEESEMSKQAVNADDPVFYEQVEDMTNDDVQDMADDTEMLYDKKATILIAEDNKDFREYIAQVLEADFHIIQAENGLVAYEKAIAEQPDLIITDIVMPEMTGIELCDKIKNNITTSHISVMILTARDLLSYKIDGYETGADAYITKPFNLRLFRSRVNNLIQSNQRMKSLFRTQINIEPSEITVSTFDQKLLKKCLQIVEDNMKNVDFGVDELCREVGISRPQLYRKIKSLVGLSPVQFIRSIRLKRAAQILSQDNSSVSEVMYNVGFNNLSYFSKVFKEEFGCLPKQYKDQGKGLISSE